MNAFPVIHTDRLLLREIMPDDIHHIYAGLSHADVIQYYGVSYDSLESTQAQMEWFKNLRSEGTGLWWAVCDQNNNTFYGATGFNNINRNDNSAELGFWLLPEHWGNGYIPEAVRAIIPHGFGELRLAIIEALVETENNNSIAVLKKLRFHHTATDIDCEIKNGRAISLMKFVLTADEYTAQKT
jgi:ribosomal-protein-alanine N-acetyltransferase